MSTDHCYRPFRRFCVILHPGDDRCFFCPIPFGYPF
jgi:hypothetical protein